MIRTVGRIVLIVGVLLFGFGLIADNWAQDVPSPLKKEKSGKFGTYLVDSKGMTLYIFDKDKEAGKSTCYGGLTGQFHHSALLIDALNESYPDSRFAQFSLGSEPLQAWVCCVFDPQDSIKELMN